MFPMRLALERAAQHFPYLIAMIKEDGSQENWKNHVDCVTRLAGSMYLPLISRLPANY